MHFWFQIFLDFPTKSLPGSELTFHCRNWLYSFLVNLSPKQVPPIKLVSLMPPRKFLILLEKITNPYSTYKKEIGN